MDIRRQFWVAACAACIFFGGVATAQEAGGDIPGPQERGFKPIPVSPEKSALYTTDRMDSLLNLTEKQYDKLYKLNLKWAREDMENRTPSPRMGGRSEGAPDFGAAGDFGQGPRGNRPPSGMADRRPPRDFPPSGDREEMEKQRLKMEKRRKKREKKLKKILTDGQYALWMEKRHPAIPKDRRAGK